MLVFFGVASLVGLVIRATVGLRLRAATRRPDVADGDLCQLEQANRISSVAVIASLLGIVILGLAFVIL